MGFLRQADLSHVIGWWDTPSPNCTYRGREMKMLLVFYCLLNLNRLPSRGGSFNSRMINDAALGTTSILA
uniref:Uncharacterized protein n=1 Tax=Romanomermis culicivorax TaxID=13658 RepID=A0A915IAV1_ROMCU